MLLAVVATVVLGSEVVSESFLQGGKSPGCSSVSIASEGGTTVVAWASASNLVITRIDHRLTEVPDVRRTLDRPRTVRCVAVATSGEDSVLVWSEPPPETTHEREDLYALRLDRGGAVLHGPQRISSVQSGTRPTIAWRGASFLITAGDTWAEFGNQPLESLPWRTMGTWHLSFGNEGTTRVFDSVAPAPSSFAFATRSFTTPRWACVIARGCGYTATFTALGHAVPHWLFPDDVDLDYLRRASPGTIACSGERCFMSWLQYHSDATMDVRGRWIDGPPTSRIAHDATRAESFITSAADAERILLVWESGAPNAPRILALVIPSAPGASVAAPFVVAEGRIRPVVASLGYGRFLVAYEKAEPGGMVRAAGRIVTIDPTRRRIAR